MAQLPSIEIIKQTHDFPCDFVFKIIADIVSNLPETQPEVRSANIVDLVATALGKDRAVSISYKISSQGNHVAFTLRAKCLTPEEVHVVYERIMTLSHLRAVM